MGPSLPPPGRAMPFPLPGRQEWGGVGQAVRPPLRTNPILAEMGTRPVWLLLAQSHKLLGMNCYKRPPKEWWP